MPNFIPPDTCLADYHKRTLMFCKDMIAGEPNAEERVRKLREWIKQNSPFSDEERLQNLQRALTELD